MPSFCYLLGKHNEHFTEFIENMTHSTYNAVMKNTFTAPSSGILPLIILSSEHREKRECPRVDKL